MTMAAEFTPQQAMKNSVGQKVGQNSKATQNLAHKKIQSPLSDWISRVFLVGTE
jgi:hypothetical protein